VWLRVCFSLRVELQTYSRLVLFRQCLDVFLTENAAASERQERRRFFHIGCRSDAAMLVGMLMRCGATFSFLASTCYQHSRRRKLH